MQVLSLIGNSVSNAVMFDCFSCLFDKKKEKSTGFLKRRPKLTKAQQETTRQDKLGFSGKDPTMYLGFKKIP